MAATDVLFRLNGIDVTSHARWGSCAIHDALHAAPNTASVTLDLRPYVGQIVQIGLGDFTAANLLFGGTVLTVGESYVDTYGSTLWPATLIDWTYTLNKKRPFGTWTSISATTIAQAIVASYAAGFTSVGVVASLATVSIVFDGSEDFMTCLGRLATAIGGYADVSYSQDVQLFLTDVTAAPTAISVANPPLNDPAPLAWQTDLSQIRTRVYGKGHGEQTPSDVLASDTIVPLADSVLFTAFGGQAITGTISNGAQSQIITYTGVQLGGAGSLVGPGVAPSVMPTVAGAIGAGFTDGVRTWAYTWVTAAGESLPSPLSSAVTGVTVPTPTATPVPTTGAAMVGGPRAGAIQYALTLGFTGTSPKAQSVIGPVANYTAVGNAHVDIAVVITSDMVGYALTVCRSDDAGVTWYGNQTASGSGLCVIITAGAVGTTIHFDDVVFNASSYTYNPPTTGAGAIQHQATIAGVALGPTGTTSRKIYRTVAAGSQLKLQQTIANNTATTGVTDATVDGSLGANVPTSDTSGLTQATGQVNAGATSLLTASAAPFSSSGGWVRSGVNVIRYTGITDNTLTGIPASGAGAILVTVKYGDHVDVVPALTGVTGLTVALGAGSKVSIWVQRDDTAAQAALVTAEGGTGIHEYLIVDERRGETSLTAVCDADLAQFSRPLVSVTYQTRDPLTASGKSVSIDLAIGTFDTMFDPAVFGEVIWGESGTFTIQDVTITFDGPLLYPRYSVKAASTNFTLMDLLQKVLLQAA